MNQSSPRSFYSIKEFGSVIFAKKKFRGITINLLCSNWLS